MQQPDPEPPRSAVRALPNPAPTAHRLSATITLLKTAQASLRDGQPDGPHRADMALTAALAALKSLGDEYAEAAEPMGSNGTT